MMKNEMRIFTMNYSADVVRVTKGSGETCIYLRISPFRNRKFMANLVKLNDGEELIESGREKLIQIAGAINGLLDNPLVIDH